MSTPVDVDARRAIGTFILSVVVLGTPLIVGMYIVDESVAEILVVGFMAVPAMFASASPWIMGEFGVVAGVVTIAIALMWVPRVAGRHRAPLQS